jgi:hypothetical protein
MPKLSAVGENLIVRNSLFDIRYSFRAYGKPDILELPTAKELAQRLLEKICGRPCHQNALSYLL